MMICGQLTELTVARFIRYGKEMFICKNGYIVRAKGLAAKMRGLRVGVQRPNDLALDDIDDVNDSLMVSQNKLRLIAASIFPVLA